MSLDFQVTSNGTKSDVLVGLHVGDHDSNTFASLSSGDALTLHVSGQPDTGLQQQNLGGKTIYTTSINVASGDFIVDFTRTQGASAIGNTLHLPPAFTLTAPTATTSRASPVTVTWNNTGSGYNMNVAWAGDCIFNDKKDLVAGSDPGSFTINAGDIQVLSGHEKDTCVVTLTVRREMKTTAGFSAEFGHTSQAEGDQERVITIQSGP
jgi:hypothetical protein